MNEPCTRNYPKKFFEYTRVSPRLFDVLLANVSQMLKECDTKFISSIPPCLGLTSKSISKYFESYFSHYIQETCKFVFNSFFDLSAIIIIHEICIPQNSIIKEYVCWNDLDYDLTLNKGMP